MTYSPNDAPATRCREPLPESKTGEADDCMLIEKLRARAWDPGRRFDAADVPVAWMTERYGSERLNQDRDDIVSYASDGTVQLKAGAEEVAVYYADASREPLFPPIALAEVEKAEQRIGRPLPELLRRVYTEVANGGFGPGSGLAALTEGNRPPRHLYDWPCAVTIYERNRTQGVPASWLHLAYGGCTMEWQLSLTAADNPVLLYDADGWEPTWGEDPHDGVRHASSSLRRWPWIWADGGDVWNEVLNHRSDYE